MRAPTLHERSSSRPRMMCASTNIPGFNPAETPAATAARASPIVLRRTPPRTPIRWLIHHVSTPAATSRRSPDGVALDIRSPSTDTTTREIPVHPDPQAPPIRTSRSSSSAPSPVAKLGCRQVRATSPKRNRFAHAINPASTSPASSPSPCTSFGVAPTTMCSPSDCTSDTPTVDVVRACTLRNTSSRLSGLALQAQQQEFRKCLCDSRQSRSRWRTGPQWRPYPLRFGVPSDGAEPNRKRAGVQHYADERPGPDAGGVPVDGGRVVGNRDEGAGHS